ncbi:MAG: DUF2330 domain-containing protein [Polyangiaceae bacterium]
MFRSLLLSIPLAALALMAPPREAQACGACFVPADENTQVTGHRMIFATSQQQTTLYDQISWAGSPESFSWVLPIHGQVDVKLSADALFAFLGAQSSVQVSPPPLNCPGPPPGCEAYPGGEDGAFGGAGGSNSTFTSTTTGVTVISQETVGPYETVQLKSDDPTALQVWLSDHGYVVPADVQPVVTAYQQEGFDFLAMKLVPGQDVNAMRPVRVTSQGAGLTLPLRMVAGGTGAITPITLFIVSEGRYEAQNFPNLLVDPAQLVFHYQDYTSNYEPLIKSMFEASDGKGWLTQYANPFPKSSFENIVLPVLQNMPGQTDWGDPNTGVSEYDDAVADLDTLFAGMAEQSTWITRVHAQLSRAALADDLNIQAASAQDPVSNYLQAPVADGPTPQCPDYSWCTNNGAGDPPGAGSWNGFGSTSGSGGSDGFSKSQSACNVQGAGSNDGPATALLGIGLAAAAVAVRRRRDKK